MDPVRSTGGKPKRSRESTTTGATRARQAAGHATLYERFTLCTTPQERQWFLDALPADVRSRFTRRYSQILG